MKTKLKAIFAVLGLSLAWSLILPYRFHAHTFCIGTSCPSFMQTVHHWELFGGFRIAFQELAGFFGGPTRSNGSFTYGGVAMLGAAAVVLAILSYVLLSRKHE
jgi:hypothetical protein